MARGGEQMERATGNNKTDPPMVDAPILTLLTGRGKGWEAAKRITHPRQRR
jgi:hypothetical protein